ncbi:MAG: biotin transporter BioY [Candidatus Hydrogenedentes bacterium]|nr:biotin transporter BioY [Candidatus Hydrogenedentota bacterium]
MNNTHAIAVDRPQLRDRWWVALGEIIAVAGLIMLAAHVRIPLPWTPIPVTLQTLPVLAAGYVVGRNRATWGVLYYLALGLAGAPMFTMTLGPTVGYLLAFIAVPWIVTSIKSPAWGLLAATATIYILGTIWLCLWLGIGVGAGLLMAVVPFVPADIVKAAVAYGIASRSTR